MSTQGYSSSPSRNATKSPKVSVSSKGNGKVAGNQTGPTNTATGHAPGSSVKGFSGQGTKGGKIKV